MMRQIGPAPIDWALCGTEANWRRHYRLGEKPCEACRQAYRRIENDRKRMRRQRRQAMAA